MAVLYITDVTDNNNNTDSISSLLFRSQVCGLFSDSLFSLSLCLSSVDGHHLWETEAKVDRDASKSVSDTRNTVLVMSLVSFQDESSDETAVLDHSSHKTFSVFSLEKQTDV